MAEKKPGFWDFVKAAFNARPLGMFVAPNWVFLAGVGVASVALGPFVLPIGAGVELAYLLGLATNKRFQRVVTGKALAKAGSGWQVRREDLLKQLPFDDRAVYEELEQRCSTILRQQKSTGHASDDDLKQQAEGLSRLTWIFLRLLFTRTAIVRLLSEAETSGIGRGRDSIDDRIEGLERQLRRDEIPVELRRSLEGQLQILQKRRESQSSARDNLAFIDAELTRIREQVELIKEQAVLSSDPSLLSTRIDEVGSTLGATTQWMRDKQDVFGQIDAMMEETPPGDAVLARE